jgi:membrane protease YdiL (CAAX protease family)
MKTQTKFPYQFFVVTFLWSWLLWLPLVLAGAGIIPISKDLQSALVLPLVGLGAFGPAVGAFYCLRTINGKGAIRNYLRGLLDLRFGWKAWLFPILVFGGSTWLAWILPELWGEPRLKMLLPSVWVFLPYVLIMTFLGGGQEELGWRGYILDPMEERLGPWLGNLVLGVIWTCWHIPVFFIPGTSQTVMPFLAFMVLMIGYSWFYGWIRQVSGKRTMAGLIAHGWSNAFIPLFPIIVLTQGSAQPRFWLIASLTFLIGLVTMSLRSRKLI